MWWRLDWAIFRLNGLGRLILTYSIYVLCTAFLFLNLSVFERTVTRTTANLVSVEQIDIDRELVTDKREYARGDYDFSKPYTRSYPPYDVVMEMAKRYQLNTSFDEEEISVKVHEISQRVERISWNQPSAVSRELGGLAICRASLVEGYMSPILFFLFVPVVLFMLSHVHLRMALIIAAIYCCVLYVSGILGVFTFGFFPAVLYVLLCAIVVHGNGKLNRFATLLIIPYTLMGSFLLMILSMDVTSMTYHYEMLALYISLIFTSIISALSGAFFIKKYFDPTI